MQAGNTEHIFFKNKDISLEAFLDPAPGGRAVVITHPHPLYGGDMHSPVVGALAAAYSENNFTALRINLRGVGHSQGDYDDGPGESDDVLAAVDYLKNMGKTEIHLSGYSFGSWVNTLADRKAPGMPMTMVAPPLAMMDFSDVRDISGLSLVVAGSHDDFGPPALIEKALSGWNSGARLETLQGADHFFWNHLKELEKLLDGHLKGLD